MTKVILGAPFYWKDITAVNKMHVINNQNKGYDTYFIGSSRTYRQIISTQFDSLNNSSTFSFNAGLQGLFYPYTIYLAEKILKEKKPDRIYVELGKSVHPAELRNSEIYNDLLMNFFAIKYFVTADDYNIGVRFSKSKVHVYDLIVKLSNTNILNYYIPDGELQQIYTRNNGFLSLDQEAKFNDLVAVRKQNEDKLQNILDYYQKECVKAYANRTEMGTPHNPYYKSLVRLINMAKVRDIEIRFYLPTRFIEGEADEIVPVFNALPDEHKILIEDSEKFRTLFHPENSWDNGHLNQDGAVIFTELLQAGLKN